MKGSRPRSAMRIAVALIILAACAFDKNHYAAAVNDESPNYKREPERYHGSKLRKLGKAVPVRSRDHTRTTSQWGSSSASSWGSSTQIIPNYDGGSKSSKGGKSGKAQRPTIIQQIIVYIPSPTRMPVSEKPTISPKPSAAPTAGPTRTPSGMPSTAPTAVASDAPSDFPSRLPSAHPSRLASEAPSDDPSNVPTVHPSGLPSTFPSLGPSNLPSTTPSDLPSTMPSAIPTPKPEAFDVSDMPSKVGLKSPQPTAELSTPTPSVIGLSSPTPSITTVQPTKGSKTSKPSPVGTQEASTSTPTGMATSEEPTALASIGSDSPTVEATSGPTGTIVDERQNLQMQLFGVEVLTQELIETYERETEAYIENFYNNYTGNDEIRGDINGVTAKLIVTDWTEPVDPSFERSLTEGQRMFHPKKITEDGDLTAEDKAKVIVLDVTEPCTGEAPLTVTFTLELEYRTADPKLNHLDIAISSPFITVESREEFIGDYLQSNDEFGTLYCSSRMIFPDYGTMAPTPAVTDAATSEVDSDEKEELVMLLYGIDLLTSARIETYEQETAAYIEDYYNSYTGNDGLRAQVSDVSALVTVTDWTQPSNPFVGVKRIFPRKVGRDFDLIAEDKAKVVVLDVSEPCIGESPLTVVFTLKLDYRVDDPKLADSDLIISTPFQTVDARSVYIGDYLQSGDEFNALYCSSRIIFDDGRTPTPTVITTPVLPGSMTPTPSIVNSSSIPTATGTPTENLTESISPTQMTSAVPTMMNETLSPASNTSLMPTYNATMSSIPSITPTILNGTITPTIAGSANASVVPTPAPSVLNASVAPSILNASIVPTVLNTSIAPTVLNASIAPTIENVTLNGTSLAPSISPNATSLTPTIFISAAPTATLPPWEMRLYGLTEELVAESQPLYNERTAIFIESFYNGVSNDGIQGQISDMDATVEIVGQIPPVATRSYFAPIQAAVHHGTKKHRSKRYSQEESFSFLPKEHHFGFGDRRYLQEDPCSGPFLLLRLKISITYVTLDTNLTADEVLTAAFIDEASREDYLNNYLQAGIAGGAVFGNVTCTSELLETSPKSAMPTPAPNVTSNAPTVFIQGNITSAPSIDVGNATSLVPTIAANSNISVAPTPSIVSSVPTVISVIPDNSTTAPPSIVVQASVAPTLIANITTPPPANEENDDEVEIDDIFGDPTLKSVRARPSRDRKCSNVDEDTRSNTEEVVIKFVYGVESKSRGSLFIRDLEEVILDFLTTSVLRCDESAVEASIQPRINSQVMELGVIRIRYPESGNITTIIKTCDAALSEAHECLVLSSSLLITISKNRVVYAHQAVLKVMQDAFSKGIFSEFVPELVFASYLGPDADSFQVASIQAVNGSSYRGIAVALIFSLVVIFGAAVWVLVSSPLTRQEVVSKVRSTLRRRKYSAVSERSREDNLAIHRDDDEAFVFSRSQHSESLLD